MIVVNVLASYESHTILGLGVSRCQTRVV